MAAEGESLGAPAPSRGGGSSSGGGSSPTRSNDTGSNAISRYIAPAREPLAPRGGSRTLSDLPYDNSPVNPNLPTIIPGQGILPGWLYYNWPTNPPADPGSTVDPTTGQRFYPGDDPFSVLADLYLRAFGADNPQSGTTQYSVVPTEVGGGGGGSSLLMLVVLAAAGFGIYWFYFRKKGGEHAG